MTKVKKEKRKFSKKGIAGLALAGILVATPMALVGCAEGKDGEPGTIWKAGTDWTEFTDAKVGDFFVDKDDYVLYQKTESSWSVVIPNYGKPGTPGQTGPTGPVGPQGPTGNAPTVTIDDAGYWVINGVPTSTKAQGPAGETPTVEINDDGYWVINGEPTEVKAEAVDGKDGNAWFVDTIYPTEANKGDLFLNNSSWNVYQYDGTDWVLMGNIKGADGEDLSSGSSSSTTTTTGTTVPSYWKSYLDKKIAEINAKSEAYGGSADAFIFITDQHLQGSIDNSAALINYICENTSIKTVFMGGDIVQGSSSDNALLREYREAFDDDLLVLAMRGNHDVWGNATESSFWDIMNRPVINKVGMTDKLYYCYDNEAQKIRYIFTDSTYASTDGDSNLTSPEQLAWMKTKILELDSDWTALVLHHGIWTAGKGSTIEINKDGQLMIDAIDSIYDDAKCTIAGIYSGHAHRDYVGYSSKGYLLVSTTLDSESRGQSVYDIVNPTRTAGTTTEQTFDVVFINPTTNAMETIRIGVGAGRTFSYGSKIPQPVQGVTLNKTSATTWANGNMITLTATLNPTNATNKEVTWSILSGAELGAIIPNGLSCTFSPNSTQGEVVVQVKTAEGDFTATCTITITDAPSSTEITSEFTWTPGTVNFSTGAVGTTDTHWVYSNLVDVSSYDSITFNHIQTSNANTSLGYAFYNESQGYVSGATNGGSSYTPVRKTIDIPTGAKYFRVMWINTTNSNYSASIHEIGANFYCYGNPFSASEGEAGGSGSGGSGSGGETTDPVDPPETTYNVESVALNKETATTWINGNVVSLTATINPTNATNKEVTWSILSGEALGTLSSSGLTCIFTPGATTGEVVIQVKTVDGEFTDTCTITIVEEATKTDITSSFTWTAGAINHKTGAVQTDTNWKYSNFVDISAYKSVTFSHIQTSNANTSLGYAFYSSTQTYISGGTNGGSSYTPIERTIDVPVGAKYIRVMWINTTSTNYNASIHDIGTKFYFYGNPDETPKPVLGVNLNKETAVVLKGGNTVTISAVLNPENATNQGVTWSILSGDTLGTISPSGLSCVFTSVATTGEVVIQVMTAEGGFTDTCTITIVEEIEATNLTSLFTWTPGTITYSSGQTGTTDKNWLYSNLVDIDDFSSITFTHIQTTNMQTTLGFAFYDANQNRVSGGSNGGSSYSPVEKTLDIPANAKYVRLMWINTTNANYNASIHEVSANFYCYGNP